MRMAFGLQVGWMEAGLVHGENIGDESGSF